MSESEYHRMVGRGSWMEKRTGKYIWQLEYTASNVYGKYMSRRLQQQAGGSSSSDEECEVGDDAYDNDDYDAETKLSGVDWSFWLKLASHLATGGIPKRSASSTSSSSSSSISLAFSKRMRKMRNKWNLYMYVSFES